MKKLIIILWAALAVANAEAQTPAPDTTTRYFIIQASIGGLQEINSGQLAAQKAEDPGVKAFARQMVTDHQQAQDKLMQLVNQGHYSIPVEATGGTMTDLKLKSKSGNDFDRLYVHMMVADHRSTIKLFEEYAVTGKDPVIRNYVQEILPVLKQHLKMITAIDDKMK